MARIRSVTPQLRTSELVASWPLGLRYFWVLLWGYCDDFGRGRDNSRLIVADAFPLDDDIGAAEIEEWMSVLAGAGLIERYEVDGGKFFHVVGWKDLQKVSHPSRSTIPASPAIPEPSGDTPEGLRSVSGDYSEERGEGVGSREGGESPHCKAHPNGTTEPCRACGDARRTFDAAARAEARKTTPKPPRARELSGYCTQPGHSEYPSTAAAPCTRCAEEALEANRSAA